MTEHDRGLEWYYAKLRGENPPVHEGDPQCGYYRKRTAYNKDGKRIEGPSLCAAIWRDSATGELRAELDHKPANPDDIWLWVCKTPVTHEAYTYYVKHGRWADDVSIGHNQPPSDADQFKSDIDELCRSADAHIEQGITTQEQADKAANFRTHLNKLKRAADEARAAEKKPHDDAGKAVQARYKPVIDQADAAAKKCAAALTEWQMAEEKRKKREIVEQIQAGKDIDEVDLNVRATSGTAGRATALRTTYRAQITDYDKALHHFAKHEDVKALIQRLADAEARKKQDGPGWVFKAERKAA